MQNTSAASATVNLTELLENSRIGPLQIRVFVLCMACLIMDGFDVQAMGYVAPAVLAEFGAERSVMGPVFAAANFGVLLGSLVFSMVADKIGRRPVIVWSTVFFSVMTIATAYAQTLEQLLWLRFIAGIGMGCIIPNATALVGEFSPKTSRVTLVMCITVGFTVGAAIGGFVAAWLIPAFGWRSVFIFGGAVPLVIAVVMLWSLPESLQFIAVRRRRLDQLARWLKVLAPTLRVDANTQYVANETSKGGVPLWHLFREGRAVFTVLLWIVNFMNILMLYSLSNWLPTLVTGMGYNQQTSVLVGTLLQVGGTIGTFGLAWFIARRGFVPCSAHELRRGRREHCVHRSTGHLAHGTERRGVHRRLVRGRRATWAQRDVGELLPHLPPSDRRRRRPRCGPDRRDRRSVHRRRIDRAAMGIGGVVLRGRRAGAGLDGHHADHARRVQRDYGGARLCPRR